MIGFFRKLRQSLLEGNKFSRYLLYALGEIILVVIGILIALQINNANEDRKSAIQEELYLRRLLTENKEDIRTFTQNIADLNKGIETIKGLSKALTEPDHSDEQLLLAARNFFQYGSIYPVFSSSTSTFDDLSSTGNLKLIRNTELREQIVKHYAKHKQISEWIRVGTEWALPNDAPFTYSNSIMRFEPASAFLFGDQLPADLVAHLRDKKIEYINNAAIHYWINKDAIDRLESLVVDTTIIIDEIDKELNR